MRSKLSAIHYTWPRGFHRRQPQIGPQFFEATDGENRGFSQSAASIALNVSRLPTVKIAVFRSRQPQFSLNVSRLPTVKIAVFSQSAASISGRPFLGLRRRLGLEAESWAGNGVLGWKRSLGLETES